MQLRVVGYGVVSIIYLVGSKFFVRYGDCLIECQRSSSCLGTKLWVMGFLEFCLAGETRRAVEWSSSRAIMRVDLCNWAFLLKILIVYSVTLRQLLP